MDRQLEIGKWNMLPHYVVVGDPNNFYLWVNEDGRGGASKWIRGKEAFSLYFKLKSAHVKNKPKFVDMVKQHHDENLKDIG